MKFYLTRNSIILSKKEIEIKVFYFLYPNKLFRKWKKFNYK